jgi:hypothetical protein
VTLRPGRRAVVSPNSSFQLSGIFHPIFRSLRTV